MTRTHQSAPFVPGTVRVRLRGLPADNDRAVAQIGEIFQVSNDAGNKTMRHENTAEQFRYLHAGIPDPKKVSCVLCGCTGETECNGGCTWMANPYGRLLCTACGETIADLVDEWTA